MLKGKFRGPLAWHSGEESERRRFSALLATEQGAKLFDDKYFEAVDKKKDKAERLWWKLVLIEVLLLGILFLNAVIAPFKKTELTLFGLAIEDVDQMKEVLLFCYATLSIGATILGLGVRSMKSLCRVWTESLSADETVRGFLHVRYAEMLGGQALGHGPALPHQTPTIATQVLARAAKLILRSISLCLRIGAFSMIIVVLHDVWARGSLPWPWPEIVVIYAIATVTLALLMHLMMGWTPWRDDREMAAWLELTKTDPQAAKIELARLVKLGRVR